MTDNKKFWKIVKPYLSDKSVKLDKRHLNENGKLIKSKSEIGGVLKNFFSSTATNLKIPEYENLISNIGNIKDPVFRVILKRKIHPKYQCNKKKSRMRNFLFMKETMKKLQKKLGGCMFSSCHVRVSE